MVAGLQVAGVRKRFGRTQVLQDVSIDAPPGRVTALIGQNGAGKTTLFKILMGLVAADGGRASLDGIDILALPTGRKGEAGLGYLPQENGSFPELTVAGNLTAMLELHPLAAGERRKRRGELLELVGLKPLADRLCRHLSAGERRRLELAKAFIARPRILLLDEPFSGLDPCIVEEIVAILRNLARDGVGILVTDHNAHTMVEVGQYAYLLAEGRIVSQGPPRELLAGEEAKRLYFGRGFGVPR